MDNHNTAIAPVPITQLGDWWQESFGKDWEPLNRFFNHIYAPDPCSKIRVKNIDWALGPENSVLLVFSIKIDEMESNNINCRAQVRPILMRQTLKPKTTLSIFSKGQLLFSVSARDADNLIQFKFDGKKGDRFSLRASLGLESYCEEFEL